MNIREHSKLARLLIEACGGLDEASAHCRVRKSVLSGYQNPNDASTMPADVLYDLETYCGRAIYSRALAQRHSVQATVSALMAVSDLDMSASEISHALVEAIDPKGPGGAAMTPREIDELLERLHRHDAARMAAIEAIRKSREG
ncbi:hypothetical protein E5163_14810 [Marinicauda algicola]|uniref:Uncharacterized protein n=1 Tax=Marinicauda algicola TaxID=2029849 RepID=A0A4S2GW98_9PROT|nr:hypothetical protein [Marinicauda algicola]TGY87336.1 hypothetical protein E5163_14810 [Marinicauda algicola]